MSRIIDRGLAADGRLARLVVLAPDRPGSLARLTRVLADQGANVLETSHRGAFADITVGEVEIVTIYGFRPSAPSSEHSRPKECT
ncbi:MAG: ACT domain-containing protein [Dehalococcoidia bacterium]